MLFYIFSIYYFFFYEKSFFYEIFFVLNIIIGYRMYKLQILVLNFKEL